MTGTPPDAPDAIPAYGEAGPEAESMERAAKRPAPAQASPGAPAPLPEDAVVERHGTAETDVAANIAKAAERREAVRK